MELMDFYEQIENHPNLAGRGIDMPEAKLPGVIVEYTPSGLTTRIPVEAVEKADWATIEDVLVGNREPVVLQHMTRVVGYFSRVENWNQSKIGELKDRQRGDYAIAGA